MKTILYTINYLTNGGPTRVLQNIIKNINITEYRIIILTLIDKNDTNIVNNLKKSGIEVIELKYAKKLLQIIKEKNKIIQVINDLNADIIHTHGIVSTVLVASNKVKAYKITTIHNNIFEDYKYTYGKVKGLIYALYHIYKLKRFDDVVCCSKTSYDILKGRLNNVSYIRNGVDINKKNQANIKKSIRQELSIKKDATVYIYVGVINTRKRVIELIKMFNELLLPNEYLVIVGDGELLEEAKSLANNSNIIFTGFKTNTIDYLQASDIYVSNSSSEGFSISVIEALHCGLLCLLSDIPSHKECFEINKSIYIGEYYNKSNIKTKKEFISQNIAKLNKKQIKEFAKKELSSQAMTNKYLKYYQK